MKVDIEMPKMGESVTEGTIIAWHKQPGDKVERDEILFEISTDKVDTEVPAAVAGILLKQNFAEGDTVEVGQIVGVIETDADNAKVEKSDSNETKDTPSENTEDTDEEEYQPENADEETVEVSGDLTDVEMPKMGESVTEGTIIVWHKKVGDKVEKDETLYEISTDKVDTEVPSPMDGVLAEILVQEQETVEVGTIVAKISTSGKVTKSSKKESKPAPKTTTETKTVEKSGDSQTSDRFYSPLVMNIAQKENISFDELDSISGSGADGRVTKKDVLAYLDKREKGEVTKTAKPAQSATSTKKAAPMPSIEFKGGEVETIPMDNIRQKIMEHMVASRDTSVHVTSLIEVDMTKIYNFIEANQERYKREKNTKLTYMAFIADACIKALGQYPLVNATLEGKNILKKKYVNLGIAVAMEPNGLIVPNIKNAHEKNILGLANAINDVATRARTRKITPDEIADGTFTITNYGVFGLLFGTPIINQPEVAILGVGAVQKRPVVMTVDGVDTIAIKPMMYITLAHDHRLVDGMLGGLFLKAVKEALEDFEQDRM